MSESVQTCLFHCTVQCGAWAHSIIFFFHIYLLKWLHQDLRCVMWDLLLCCTDSLVVVHGFSSCSSLALECMGSLVVALHLGHPVACGILGPQLGIEPVSFALEEGS